jgi:hypothetical protein
MPPTNDSTTCNDQTILSDCLWSARTTKLIHHNCLLWSQQVLTSRVPDWERGHDQLFNGSKERVSSMRLPLPAELAPLYLHNMPEWVAKKHEDQGGSFVMWWSEVRMPHASRDLGPDLQGYPQPFAPQRGNLSAALRRMWAETGTPMWPGGLLCCTMLCCAMLWLVLPCHAVMCHDLLWSCHVMLCCMM